MAAAPPPMMMILLPVALMQKHGVLKIQTAAIMMEMV